MTKLNKIIDEEVERALETIPTSELSNVLLTLLKEGETSRVLDSLMKDYKMNLNQENQIPEENWDWFRRMLLTVLEAESFQRQCKEVNCKLYAVINFTKIKLSLPENLEKILKFELKDYYSEIVTDNPDEFVKCFFTLPFEFISLVVRYLSNVLAKDKKELLLPRRDTADKYLDVLNNKRKNFIININNLSQGQSDILALNDLKALLDSKTFFEYNALNVGVLEFIIRIIGSSKTEGMMNQMLDKKQIHYLKQQIFSLPSYLLFLRKIKDGEEQSYFNKDGTQNEERDNTFDDFVKKVYFPNEFVPHKRKVSKTIAPPTASGETGEPGVEQPEPEELMNQ